MSELFSCVNCESIVALDKHGRCSTCGSDAVYRRALQHLGLIAKLYAEYDEIEELEALWRRE
jgi:hypothetical protein